MIKNVKTTKFNTGRGADWNNNADIKDDDQAESVRKVSSASRLKNAGTKDGLKEALSTRKPTIPTNNDQWSHTSRVRARGANYHPMGQEGSVSRTGQGRGVYSYGGNVYSAEPANAVGTYPNRKGQNAVGNPPNRTGQNANPGPRVPNRSGSNAIGSPPNRFGENALSGRFRPSFKGGPASRRA